MATVLPGLANLDSLQSILLASRIQTSNNPLYQVINQLIIAARQLRDNANSSSGEINNIVNNVINSAEYKGLGYPADYQGDDSSYGDLGLPGKVGLQGNTGLPGRPGIDGLDIEDKELLILTQGFPSPYGTYTPTLTNVANLDASTAYACQWSVDGNIVSVSGKVDVDPTLGATLTKLGISLPIASILTLIQQCAGVAFASGIAGQGAAILGDIANARAQMEWISADVTNQPMYFTFSYQIL